MPIAIELELSVLTLVTPIDRVDVVVLQSRPMSEKKVVLVALGESCKSARDRVRLSHAAGEFRLGRGLSRLPRDNLLLSMHEGLNDETLNRNERN